MEKLKYIKSKHFKDTFFYECCKCGLDHKSDIIKENCSGFNCKCGENFTHDDVMRAIKKYYLEYRTE